MQTKKNIISIIKQGCLLGLFFGLIVSFFDSFFMLIPNIQVPALYPVLILSLNLSLWAATGMAVSSLLWLFFRNRTFFRQKDNRQMVIFGLFIMIYAILGRVDINGLISPAFDHHLSILWALFILVSMVVFSKKSILVKSTPVSLLPEALTIITLFMFCSDIDRIGFLSTCFDILCPQFILKHAQSYEAYLLLKQNFMMLINTGVVVFILAAYLFVNLKLKRFFSSRNNRIVTVCLLTTVLVTGSIFYYLSHTIFLRENYPCIKTTVRPARDQKIPFVILVVLDTLRADQLSVYGTPGTSPNLKKFAQGSIVFNNCIASSPWTLPSHVSMFTGLFPVEHGSHHNPLMKKRWPLPRMPGKFKTLAGTFKSNGYQTCGVVANSILLNKGLHFNRDFNCYDSSQCIGSILSFPFRPLLPLFCYLSNIMPEYFLPIRTAETINNNVSRFLDSTGDSPFFLFVNYMDAHAPYCPPSPFDSMFSDMKFPHAYKIKQDLMALISPAKKENPAAFNLTQYDGEIAYLDYHLGRLFKKLKKMGIYDKALIIITADHGELFDEHGLSGHECTMYEGVERVPLIVKLPFSSKPAIRHGRYIVLSDLFTTILSLCNLPVPENVSGRSFGGNSKYTVAEFYDYDTGVNRALYYRQYKLMKFGKHRGTELYDLRNDPRETVNLYTKLPLIAEKMEKKLRQWETEHKPQSGNNKDGFISREIKDGLKALGYIK